MKITEVHIAQLTLPLIRPFITAVRRTECVDDVLVMIKTDTNAIAYGSAASTPAITGDTTESIIKAIQEFLAPQLIGRHVSELTSLLQINNQNAVSNTSAKAAIDIALHDLFAQYQNLPLYKMLGGTKNCIESCITVSLNEKKIMVKEAIELVSQGHHRLKIKLGLNAEKDIECARAIRLAVGEKISLLVDANQGWSYEESLKVIAAFKHHQLNIPIIEQPTNAKDLSQLKFLSNQVECSIIADESCFSPQDALTIATMRACDGINIKLMKSGGIDKAQAIYNIAKMAKMSVMVGCMLESPVGIAAIASFAVSKPDIFYADLDPLFLIRDNYLLGGAQRVGNSIVLSDRPGLGIEGISQGCHWIGVVR